MIGTVKVNTYTDISDALICLGLTRAPVVALVGGADFVSESDMQRLQSFFCECLAPVIQSLGVSVVDGGTNSGVMKCMGFARAQIHGNFPLIGVIAEGIIVGMERSTLPVKIPSLESNHSHSILVPGCQWGDESPWLAQIASALSDGFGSLTLVINGGEITWLDVANSVQQKRTVLAIAGTGRAADCLAAAVSGETSDPRANSLVESGFIRSVSLDAQRSTFERSIRELLQS